MPLTLPLGETPGWTDHGSHHHSNQRHHVYASILRGVSCAARLALARHPKRPPRWLPQGRQPRRVLQRLRASSPVHLAFVASDERAVRAFFEAALANGGKDNGPPGPRPQYAAGYYAAFVLDPDGHNIEAVVGGVHQASAPSVDNQAG